MKNLNAIVEYHGLKFEFKTLIERTLVSEFEQIEIDLAIDFFESGDKLLVAGGGLGLTSAVGAALCGPENVEVIEMQLGLCELIDSNVKVNGVKLRTHWGALVSKKSKETRGIKVNPNKWASATYCSEGSATCPELEILDLNFNALFLDVEGMEFELITDDVLKRTKSGVIEVHGHEALGRNLEDAQKFVEQTKERLLTIHGDSVQMKQRAKTFEPTLFLGYRVRT